MTNTQTHLTKASAGAFLDELGLHLATLPFEGKTAYEHAAERETMIDNLMAKQAETYHYNELIQGKADDKIASFEANITDSIELIEKRLAVYKETQTPKEAYFNILDDKALGQMDAYMAYASTYVYAVVKDILDAHSFKHVHLKVSKDVTNRLPTVVLSFAGNHGWGVNDPDNDYQKTFWFLYPTRPHYIPLSTLKRGEPASRDFERTQEHVKKVLADCDTLSANRTKYKRRFFMLPHIRRRIDRNIDWLLNQKTQKLIRLFNSLTESHSQMEDLSEKDVEGFAADAQDEIKRVASLLHDALGVTITTDLDD